MPAAGDGQRCGALTESGERYPQPSQDDGYCFRHVTSDGVIVIADGEGGRAENRNEGTDPSVDAEADRVREAMARVADELIDRPVDRILAVDREEEGWRVAVEVVERESRPSKEDVLGRYEITLDEERTVTGYRRTRRYRRRNADRDEA